MLYATSLWPYRWRLFVFGLYNYRDEMGTVKSTRKTSRDPDLFPIHFAHRNRVYVILVLCSSYVVTESTYLTHSSDALKVDWNWIASALLCDAGFLMRRCAHFMWGTRRHGREHNSYAETSYRSIIRGMASH